MTKLFILSGVPGSGKSTFAKKLEYYYNKKSSQQTESPFNIVASDDLRVELTGDRQDMSRDEDVWKLFYQRPIDYLYKHHDRTITVLDATHISVQKRLEIAERYREDYDQIYIIQFQVEKDMVLEVNRIRKYSIPEAALISYCDNLECLSEEELQRFKCRMVWRRRYGDEFFKELLEV